MRKPCSRRGNEAQLQYRGKIRLATQLYASSEDSVLTDIESFVIEPDYTRSYNQWMDEITAPPASVPYSRKNPYLAELTRHEHLTKPGSEKDTRHFVVK